MPVTLSATIDDGVQTRATSETDDKVERCLLQIIEDDGTTTTKREVQTMTLGADGSYTASTMLNPNNTYTFLFWADDGSYTATDLEVVTIAGEDGAGIAWYGSASWSSDESTTIEAELKHAVAKVTLQSTTEVSVTTTATISGVKEYSTFNVLDGTVSNEASFSHSGKGKDDAGDVFSFYALVSDETQNLTLQTGNQPAMTIPSVPLAQNKHVILKGDVAGAGLTEYTFTATIDESWSEKTEIEIIDLSTYEGTTLAVSGKTTIKGNGTEKNLQLTIEAGADVTLQDVKLAYTGQAVIVCKGDATLTFSGTNTLNGTPVEGNYTSGSGIYIEQGTLTIDAESGASLSISRTKPDGPGLASGMGICVGNNANLVIKNGNISIGDVASEGDSSGPGIGSNTNCGNITIEGGNITVGRVSWYAAGIGSVSDGDCKDITITGENTVVNVQKGNNTTYYIGPGRFGEVTGTISIGGGATVNGTKYTETHIGPL